MKIEFWMTGKFAVSANDMGETMPIFSELEKAVDYVQESWVEGDEMVVDIIDMTTGEILLHFEDEEENHYDDEPDYDECGYNPYMGCYDFDC